ncbi:hypothetical protein RMATCC62417_16189 [Rhizopus microsporus]|nr:hypothetical protein RMATCC62417_16189 [Rhizopus microsporus]
MFQSKYAHILHLADTWQELNSLDGENLTVAKEGLTNYGQVLSAACETIATSYNNYYIENFQNIVANYFIFMIKTVFSDMKLGTNKRLVYEHILDEVFSFEPQATAIPQNILSSTSQEVQDTIQAFISPLILEVKNRLPSFSITKSALNKVPFDIMPALRHILLKYETLIAENPQLQT